MVKVTCLGAAGSVTGSNFLLETRKGEKILIDCGLFQGGKSIEQRNREAWGFNPRELHSLLLTHAHIDHSGRIPQLVRDGFQGKIITSPPTAELCEIMLLDSAHVQEMDAEWQTRKNKRQGREEVLPLYTTQEAEASLQYFFPVERNQIISVGQGIKARLRNAGHILGSSILELWVEDGRDTIKIVFSGDIGKKDQLIVQDPEDIFTADYLFIESTYGNRLHRSLDDSKTELLEAINYAVSKGEKVIIPAFAVERTQEIIYLLGEFYRRDLLPDIPIYLDSPLAIKATEIFRKNKRFYDTETLAIVNKGFDPFDLPNLRFTPSTEESIAINQKQGPAIVIAGSGMCTAGRIKHHLKHNIWRPGASIVIVGFQAQGTTGRKIVDGARQIKLFGELFAVKSRIFTIGGFSAHADQKDLLSWVSHFSQSRPHVFTVHGEPTAASVFAQKIEDTFGLKVHVPAWKEMLLLKPRGEVLETFAEEEIPVDWGHVFLNTLSDLERELRKLKKRTKARGPEKRVNEDDVEKVKAIQGELQDMFSDTP